MSGKHLILALGSALILSSASACLIVDDTCYETCDTYCDVYCDAFGCWEECWDECYCTETVYEDDYYDDFVDEPQCRRDRDCGRGQVCLDGFCTLVDDEPPPAVPFCGACSSSDDCAEEGALCLNLNDDERVCARSCTQDADCPQGFECAEVSREAGATHQCLPRPVDELRTCQNIDDDPQPTTCTQDADCPEGQACAEGLCATPVPECLRSAECEEGQQCIDGRCQTPPQPCEQDADCAEGHACAEGLCAPIPTCDTTADCPQGMACMTGTCVTVECFTSADCAEAQLCVDAQCRDACTQDADCPDDLTCDPLLFCR